MGIDKVTTHTPGWFNLRVEATQNILKTMTDADKKELCRKGEEMAKKGMPEDLQRK